VTPRPVITRIVTITPRPTIPVTPLPTLSDTLMQYQGPWNLLLRYELSGHPDFPDSTAVYSSTAAVLVDLNGNVSGQGDLDFNLQSPVCGTDRLSGEALTYTLRGNLQETGGGVVLRILLLADNSEAQEEYILRCVDEAGVEAFLGARGTYIFPALLGGNLLEMRFNLANFYERQTLDIDLGQASGGQLQGILKAELYLGR
jgi:hypothetical protein